MIGALLFSRHPEHSSAKTRLRESHALTAAGVARLHRMLVQDAVDLIGRLEGVSRFASWDLDGLATPEIPGFESFAQQGSDFGARLENALRYTFERCSKVVVIGSDCPSLTLAIMKQAIDYLSTGDTVLGPAQRGGFYLLGCSAVPSGLANCFGNGDEFTRVAEMLQSDTGAAPKLLEPLNDLDYPEDIELLMHKYKHESAHIGQHTLAALIHDLM